VTTHAHPVPADGRLAPDPVALARPIHEQPSTAWVAAAPQSVALLRELQGGGQQIVRDTIPAARGRPQRAVGSESKVDVLELAIEQRPPPDGIQRWIVSQGSDRITERAQAGELAARRRTTRVGDRVARQELHGARRGIEVIVWRFPVPRTPAVMGARPMEAVRKAERGVGPQLPSNGVHRR